MNRREFLKTSSLAVAGATTSAAASAPAASGQAPSAQGPDGLQLAPRFGDGRDWWFQKRFGLFVHWGLYAIHGWHEQEQWRRRVPREEYVKLAAQWNPVEVRPGRVARPAAATRAWATSASPPSTTTASACGTRSSPASTR